MVELLLVDDEPAARMAFRDLLPWSGGRYHLCGAVANGREALHFLAHTPVDIVVTDLKMPVMDGLQLIHCLREQQFPGVILVMSNYSDFDLVREALLSGARDYMLKVNMNSHSLLEQLDRAAGRLTTQVNSEPAAERELTDASREEALYRLVLGQPDAHCAGLLDGPPYGLFLVRTVNPVGHRPASERSVRKVIESVLGTADFLRLSDGEYLCLARMPAGRAAETADSRAQQITRQLMMYLNCPASVAFAAPVTTADELQAAYAKAGQTMAQLFYQKPPVACRARDGGAGEPVDTDPPVMIAQRLTEQFAAQGADGIAAEIDGFLARCADRAAAPQAVCSCAYQVVQTLIMANPMRADSAQASLHAALLSSRNGEELRQILLKLLPPLLEDGGAGPCGSRNSEVRAAMLYIRYHYMYKVTLEEIAASVSLDKSYLCRLFKRETGQSVFQYLNGERMRRAAEMIAHGNTYVREVAAAVGIEDPFYFTRLFKKTYGVSPSEYKEKAARGRLG